MAVVKRTDGRGRRAEDKGNSTKEEVAPASKVCIFIVPLQTHGGSCAQLYDLSGSQ